VSASVEPAGVRIRGLTAGYQGAPAVVGLDLEVAPGEIVVLFGPSGCGKSTVLRVLAGLLAQMAGTIEVDGQPIAGTSAERALVFQEDALLPWRSALGNVEFALSLQGVARSDRRPEACRLLAQVALGGFERHLPRQLSGGMRQRVQLARTLATRPRVMLMDEPFGALDAQTRAAMQALLLEVWKQYRTTAVFVTHDLDEALLLGDRIVVMTSRPARVKTIVTVAEPRGTATGADRNVSRARYEVLAHLGDLPPVDAAEVDVRVPDPVPAPDSDPEREVVL
jgi:NitT/TauT family transport system ATP-binding protein